MNALRLITIDATGTIFKFREPPPTTYARIAHKHNIKFQESEIMNQFKKSFKLMEVNHPHFGATSGISSQEWWSKVVHQTFEGEPLK